MISRIKVAYRALHGEAAEWFRAGLSCIPGRVGCWIRARLYGFRAGRRTCVWNNVIIYHPAKLTLGNNVQIVPGCQINAGGGVEIADNSMIGPGVFIWSQNHAYKRADILICDQGYECLPVKIEEDVWVGAGAIIRPGVRLARGCVIAAGSVVTAATEAYTLYAGVPARPVRKRVAGEDVDGVPEDSSREVAHRDACRPDARNELPKTSLECLRRHS